MKTFGPSCGADLKDVADSALTIVLFARFQMAAFFLFAELILVGRAYSSINIALR